MGGANNVSEYGSERQDRKTAYTFLMHSTQLRYELFYCLHAIIEECSSYMYMYK